MLSQTYVAMHLLAIGILSEPFSSFLESTAAYHLPVIRMSGERRGEKKGHH